MKYIGYVMGWIFLLLLAMYFYTFGSIYCKYRSKGMSRKQAFLATWTMYE